MTGLAGYSVATIDRAMAEPLIVAHEWLGTLGRATMFVGLFSPAGELHGVACFGHGPQGRIRHIIGSPALCLERGACVPAAPHNAASFLIASACKLVCRITGTSTFFAYGDPTAGEYGGVYQAAGWLYLGQGPDARSGKARRYAVCRPGADPADPASWSTTRALRREGRVMTLPEAHAAGWRVALRGAKHVYCTNVGRGRRGWLKGMAALGRPYPAPHPERKRRQPSALQISAATSPICNAAELVATGIRCIVCDGHFRPQRADALTCSTACRMRTYRQRKRQRLAA